MAWDENLFGFFYKKIEHYRELKNGESIELDSIKTRLELIASFNWGQPVQIMPVSDSTAFDGRTLCLPHKIYSHDGEEVCGLFYLYNVLILSCPLDDSKSLEEILEYLQQEYSQFDHLTKIMRDYYPDYFEDITNKKMKWGIRQFETTTLDNTQSVSQLDLDDEAMNKKNSNLKINRNRKIKKINSLENQQDESPLTHSFEKVFTLDQFKGGDKKIDGSDELDEHSNALRELTVDTTINSDQMANAFIKVDIFSDYEKNSEQVHHQSEKVFLYPEWSSTKGKYRNEWVQLKENQYDMKKPLELNAEEQEAVRILTAKYSYAFNMRRQKKGLPEGADIDIDRLTDFRVNFLARSLDDAKIFSSPIPSLADWTVLILVDRSLSTESWFGDHKVLDVEISCLKVLMSLFEKVSFKWGAATFHSNTRHDVHFDWIKDLKINTQNICFDESAISPIGSTRLGSIVRHSLKQLEVVESRKKMILFLSDLKPTDFDFYEGAYGLGDFKKSVLEARQSGTFFHMIGIAPDISEGIRKNFKPSEYSQICNPKDLTKTLLSVVKRHISNC